MATPDQTGSVLDGRFALEAEHKRGGMGTVWRASDLRTHQPVAVKILHVTAAELAQRFAREATLLADLAHGSIVSYVAHGTTPDGTPYLAMEWLDGENLAERLARGPLTIAESLTLVAAAARGLTSAHERGIVHRDLKPSNLFVRRGRLDDVVVLDLGIARHVGGADALTHAGTILGTPSYMAPEQAQGLVDITPAADVFSLGCVLFECLAGAPPFVGDHVFAVLAKVLFEDTPRLRALRPEVPTEVEALVERMLDKDPARRPGDAAALLAALAALGDVEPTLAAPPAASPRAGPVEQELVSVILATREAAASSAAAADSETVDLTVFGGKLKRLADGTTVITLAHRRGAATDLAVRAARCALRLRDSGADWNIVLATGRAVPRERVHIGEVVDRAGAMLRAGGERTGASIWVDEVTAGLLDARFRTTPIADGILALEGEEPTIDPTRPLLGRPTACVGREHELAALELTLRVCIDEATPRAMLILGPPGMGKTRLRHELMRRSQARGDDLVVLLGLGDPIRTSSTGGLLGSAVARLCGVRAGASQAESWALVDERIGRHVAAPDRRRTVALMGELCGVRCPDDALPELSAAQHDPRLMARLCEQAWLTFLRAEAAVKPVLLVLDDLQWSDALTVALVDTALRELESSPVMVLALARPEATEVFPDLWAQRVTMMPLPPLAAAPTARLVRQVLGDRIGDDGVARIVARAGGNALYLEELIRAASTGRTAVPETVVAMLQARIGLLEPAARRVLRAASVFGERFPVDGVDVLVRGALAPAELQLCLATLARHEILEQQVDPRGGHRWRFRHALMRDAAYGLLTAEDRVASHALAARFLGDAGEDHAVVATHFELGGDAAAAVRHFTAAAELAYRRADHAAIRDLVGRGVAAGASGEDLGVLRSIEAPTLFFRYDFAGSWAANADALALLRPGHPRRKRSLASATFCGVQMGKVAEVVPLVDELYATDPRADERADYVTALGWACLTRIVVANREAAGRLIARIADIDAQAEGRDAVVRAQVLFWRRGFLEFLGEDPYATWDLARQCTELHRLTGDRRLLAHSLVSVGQAARWLFSVDEGARSIREGLQLARELGEGVTFDFLLQFLTTLLAEHGTPVERAEARELALPMVERAGGSLYRMLGLVSLALVDLRDGDPGAAEAHARAARAMSRSLAQPVFFPHVDRTLLQVLTRKGDPEAGALADEALRTVDTLGPMGHLDLPLRDAAARAHLAVGRREEAVRGVRRALAGLARQASRIPDADLRSRFLGEVPENVALRELARELGAAES